MRVSAETASCTGFVVPGGRQLGQGGLQALGWLRFTDQPRAVAIYQGAQRDGVGITLPAQALGHGADLEVALLGDGGCFSQCRWQALGLHVQPHVLQQIAGAGLDAVASSAYGPGPTRTGLSASS